MNKKLNNIIIILIAFFLGFIVCKNYNNNEHFGYIKRQSQVTHRRRRHQGWHESARSG